MPNTVNDKYTKIPLTIENMTFRGGEAWLNMLGIYVQNGEIIYLYTGLQDVPLEDPVKNTIFPQFIIADFFAPDFKEHTQAYITYKERKTFYTSCAECSTDDDRIIVNTMRYMPTGYYQGNGEWGVSQSHEDNALAKLLEIQNGAIREIGVPPEPIQKVYPDSKTYHFGDCVLSMTSPFKLTCKSASTSDTIWEMRLTAYLYTDLELRDGILYFGTAGKGGRFYGVSLELGREIFAYDTGGTTYWSWHKDYVWLTDRKGDMLFLNPKDGAVIKKLHFKGLETSIGIIYENCIYTIAWDKKHKPYALRIELGEE